MSVWTDDARRELIEWTASVRRDLDASADMDAAQRDEIALDMGRHVEEELAREGAAVVTVDDVRRVTSRVGKPADAESAAADAPVFPEDFPRRRAVGSKPNDALGCFAIVGGVLLPIIAVLTEYATRQWTSLAFDPLPTPLHALAILTVPVAVALRASDSAATPERRRLAGVLTGIACGVSATYAAAFAPLIPLCLLGLFYGGLGIVSMAPFFAVVAAFRARAALRVPGVRTPGAWWGVAACLALVAYSGQEYRVRQLADVALGSDVEAAREAQETLRAPWYRLTASALRAPRYGRIDLDGFGAGNREPAELGRLRWYVNGEAPSRADTAVVRSWNSEIRGVAGWAQGVGLDLESYEAVVDADRALTYGELTFVFGNQATWDQEAELAIDLPPGGSITRASLWNKGVEVPAAFAPVHKATAAYEAVVRQRRDPILITTYGRDRVLLRCFPVPARGTMKVRLGVTAPLAPTSADAAVLDLPTIVHTNFWAENSGPRYPETASVVLRLHGDGELIDALGRRSEDGVLRLTRPPVGTHTSVALRRTSPFPPVEDVDYLGGERAVVRQRVESRSVRGRKRVVFALDGAASFDGAADDVVKLLDAFDADRDVGLVVSDADGVRIAVEPAAAVPETRRRLQDAVRALKTRGDRDDVPLLLRAYDLAAERGPSAVVWLRGIQPYLDGRAEPLLARLNAAPAETIVVDAPYLPASGTPHALADALTASVAFKRPRGGGSDGVLNLLAESGPGGTRFEASRSRHPHEITAWASAASRPTDGGSHLARLWARDEVDRLSLRGEPGWQERASALSLRYGLVTDVVGSVALESTDEMSRAGLSAPQPGETPRIPVSDVPEPETYALLCVAAVAVGIAAWRMRRRTRKAFAA
jgi:hypothetical protein